MCVFMCYNSVTQYNAPRGGGHINTTFVVFLQQRNLYFASKFNPIGAKSPPRICKYFSIIFCAAIFLDPVDQFGP